MGSTLGLPVAAEKLVGRGSVSGEAAQNRRRAGTKGQCHLDFGSQTRRPLQSDVISELTVPAGLLDWKSVISSSFLCLERTHCSGHRSLGTTWQPAPAYPAGIERTGQAPALQEVYLQEANLPPFLLVAESVSLMPEMSV